MFAEVLPGCEQALRKIAQIRAENRPKVASKRAKSDACIGFSEREQARRKKMLELVLNFASIRCQKFGGAGKMPYLCSVKDGEHLQGSRQSSAR